MDVLETGFNSIAGGVELTLDCLTNCIGKSVTTAFFASTSNINGAHSDFISRGAKIVGKRDGWGEKNSKKGREKKKTDRDMVSQGGELDGGHMTAD